MLSFNTDKLYHKDGYISGQVQDSTHGLNVSQCVGYSIRERFQ